MKFVDQTRLGGRGNCLAACLATITGLELDAVDVTCFDERAEELPDWFELLCAKLRRLGWSYATAAVSRSSSGLPVFGMTPGDYFVAIGKSRVPGGLPGILHAVVARARIDGYDVVHDPHPARAGIGRIRAVGFVFRRSFNHEEHRNGQTVSP